MTTDRLPPLNAVRAFEAAARLVTYVAAAQALHVTQPAIGRHVKILEDWLGVRLLDRSSRGVSLTRDGAYYYQSVSQSLRLLADAGMHISRRKPERWLRILCVPAFASRWLTPRIDELRTLRPELKIAIEPNATFTSVDARHADLGISYGFPGEFAGVQALLIRPEVFAVSSPLYRQGLAQDLSVEALAQCRLIHVDNGSWWSSWLTANGVRVRVKADASHVSNDIVLKLAEEGQGIALATEVLVSRQLAEGTLVRCTRHSTPLESYQVLSPTPMLSDDAIWFIDWLKTSLGMR